MSLHLRTVPGWTVSADSAANSSQTLTKSAGSNQHHYVNAFEVVISGAAAGGDITVVLKAGGTQKWKTVIGSGAARGERTGICFTNPIDMGLAADVTLEVSAGGAGVVTSANLEGFSL